MPYQQKINNKDARDKFNFDSNKRHFVNPKWEFNVLKYPQELENSTDLTHYVAFYISVPAFREADRPTQEIANEFTKQIQSYSSGSGKASDALSNYITGQTKKLQQERQNLNNQGQMMSKANWAEAKERIVVIDAEIEKINNQEVGLTSLLKNQYSVTKDMICLYIPETLSTAYALDWQADSFRTTSQLAQTASNMISGYQAGGEGVMGAVKGVMNAATQFAGGMAQMAVGKVLESDMASAAGKIVANPYMEVLFRGVQQRGFTLDFKFTPKSPKEANEVHDIIQMFKKYAHPDTAKGQDINDSTDMLAHFWVYPAEWDIIFYTIINDKPKQNEFLARYGRSVLTGITVNYGNTQFLRPTDRGAPPVETSLSLTFKEIDLITQQHLDDGF